VPPALQEVKEKLQRSLMRNCQARRIN